MSIPKKIVSTGTMTTPPPTPAIEPRTPPATEATTTCATKASAGTSLPVTLTTSPPSFHRAGPKRASRTRAAPKGHLHHRFHSNPGGIDDQVPMTSRSRMLWTGPNPGRGDARSVWLEHELTIDANPGASSTGLMTTMVILGASGDLTRRLLLPALAGLDRRG